MNTNICDLALLSNSVSIYILDAIEDGLIYKMCPNK